ncbi:MAG: hypothetical protein A3B91_03385 [Candidatus Yanofskybacteria bacterium RIFCSPHIGHO2_02_FULL_41_29]|uniref:Uncharacterized protein n=1 Tax=Candidatus Yanofskybacteria bacterium RIFCSPHIGHO2_01_FULL_41_53 TaxID=1802663 RepID=A0A1F8EGR2_9BACT|nr:MAG: hypothetical protein A2650_01210 [Candidatus Yanofskybacteria bacterium RIFCSPHIGHO2_01_FULL_41_53]OGN10704.1 MAG: hypothetical protein A3B91_03385 [Candidatus Yanofskybacteria bacterium RIFCSPHIGHO2_02_FULL_41_29]OGN18785.1 MAG: hypothetical protein A3F48_02445 [Candidatus Yanofskybacteria bacterium RIFCSPHIGHO2_12_FULL_41_9]OGN24038.1 MAG: hypothetical protein A2916_04745 [Candidatus Yanofskybacteria bacterium RIFCSPLOWO2_01_FULL_41_67]OGN30502.1 MAG: hypothetical protein A3H54_00555 
MNLIKYNLWPLIKVKTMYWWWIVKYGGKKKIPHDLVFKKIEETMQSFKDDLMQAVRYSPEDMTEEERKEFIKILEKTGELSRGIKSIK